MNQYKDKCFKNIDWIIDQLEKENIRQIEKWGVQICSIFEWLAYTAEEFGSLAKAINEHEYRGGSKEKIISEAFQVATLAVKIAEMYKNEGNIFKKKEE